MKKSLSLLLVFILAACSQTPPQVVVKTEDGTFRQIRPEGKLDKSGAYEIAIWAKDGVSTNEYVYMQRTFADGKVMFTRMIR